MRLSALASLAALLAIPSSVSGQADGLDPYTRLIEPCRSSVALIFATGDTTGLERYMSVAGMNEDERELQTLICTAYIDGVTDAATGRLSIPRQ